MTAIQDDYPRHKKFTRWSTGLANSLNLKNVYNTSFGYTSTKKKIAAGSATAVLGSTSSRTSPYTITSGITNPDVPRALQVVVGGTAGQVLDTAIVITGTNSEGKVITENFVPTAGATGTINGAKAFMTVASIFWPAQLGTGVTITVGTQNKLGVFHRLIPNNTTVKVITDTGLSTTPVFDGVPTVTADASVLENNLVTPLTAPDGTKFMYICYQYDNWVIGQQYDGTSSTNALFHTTTSTSSTSTSTTTSSLTTSTSTSSTSTSSTSSSISTSSTSTSSTSTSTTTTP